MGNICPGSNRRSTSRDISNGNSNRSSIMQSLFRTSNRPQFDTNNINHNNDNKNSNVISDGNNNCNAPATMPTTNVEGVNSRSLPQVVVSKPSTVAAAPVPIKISDLNHENMKINHNDVQRESEPRDQGENQNKNVNAAQNETRQIRESPSSTSKPKRRGSRKPHHRRVPSAAGLRVESVLNRKTEMMKDVYTVGNFYLKEVWKKLLISLQIQYLTTTIDHFVL